VAGAHIQRERTREQSARGARSVAGVASVSARGSMGVHRGWVKALKAQWRGAAQLGRWPSGAAWPSPEEGGPVAQASSGIKEIFVENFLCTEQCRKPSRRRANSPRFLFVREGLFERLFRGIVYTQS
jgi:hypothetical protein